MQLFTQFQSKCMSMLFDAEATNTNYGSTQSGTIFLFVIMKPRPFAPHQMSDCDWFLEFVVTWTSV